MYNKKKPENLNKKFPENQRKKITQKLDGKKKEIGKFDRKEQVINSFKDFTNKFVKNINPKQVVSEKYEKFIQKVNEPKNKQLMKLLPLVLLALTILAVKNKRLIKPLIDAYMLSSEKLKPDSPLTEKVLFIIKEYIYSFTKLSSFESVDIALATLSLFLEDIPSIFKQMNTDHGFSEVAISKNIAQNVINLHKDLVEKPLLEKKEREERLKEKIERNQLSERLKQFEQFIRSQTNPNPNTNSNTNQNTNSNTNQNTNSNANQNTNSNTNPNTNSNTNQNTNANRNTNRNANRNTNRNANRNTSSIIEDQLRILRRNTGINRKTTFSKNTKFNRK